jgi:hypothetical protein
MTNRCPGPRFFHYLLHGKIGHSKRIIEQVGVSCVGRVGPGLVLRAKGSYDAWLGAGDTQPELLGNLPQHLFRGTSLSLFPHPVTGFTGDRRCCAQL